MESKNEHTIRDTWRSFKDAAISDRATGKEVAVLEMAFYSGAMAMFDLLAKAASQDAGEEPSKRELLTVSTLYTEMQEWSHSFCVKP
jgi:hypothetical protein